MANNSDSIVNKVVEQIQKIGDVKIIKKIAEELLSKIKNFEAIVYHASELSAAEKIKIEKLITEKFGEVEKIHYKTDESLLGGFRIEFGEFFIDKSMKNSLKQLKAKFN